jgi:hypothetical protein
VRHNRLRVVPDPPLTADRRIGLDTVSFGWSDGGAVDRFLRLDGLVPAGRDSRPLRLVSAPGGAVRLNRRLDGLGQVGAFPGADLLFVEGRAGALARKDESDHSLGRPAELPEIKGAIGEDLGRLLGYGIGEPGIRRADLSGELNYEDGRTGRELLWLLDQMHSPRHKTSSVCEMGGPGLETVYWRTPKRNIPHLRAYDKGVETETQPPGERIRVERQVRYPSGKRQTVEQWLEGDLGAQYVAPILTWINGGLCPGTASELLRLMTDGAIMWLPCYWASGNSWYSRTGRRHAPVLTAGKIERLQGTLFVLSEYGKSYPLWSARTAQKRLAEIRPAGLLLLDRRAMVDPERELRALCDLWRVAA